MCKMLNILIRSSEKWLLTVRQAFGESLYLLVKRGRRKLKFPRNSNPTFKITAVREQLFKHVTSQSCLYNIIEDGTCNVTPDKKFNFLQNKNCRNQHFQILASAHKSLCIWHEDMHLALNDEMLTIFKVANDIWSLRW